MTRCQSPDRSRKPWKLRTSEGSFTAISKPANIKLRPDGTVKLLDFGLAKILQQDMTVDGGTTGSATLTSPSLMRRGVILGTAAYASPEQARGQEADKRSDIWAFGAVLYEMLSGRRAFPGDDVSDTIAAVLHLPIDWSALDPSTPVSVRRLLARCLERDVRRRLRDIGEARIVLEDPIAAAVEGASSSGVVQSVSLPLWRRVLTPMAAAIVAAAAVGAAVWAGTRPSDPQVSRFAVSTTATNALSVDPQSRDLTITANGTHIVYKGGIGGSSTQLFVRGLDQLDPAPLTAPGLPKGPFSSPDGQWIGFFVPGRPVTLKKVAITGGPAIELSGVDGPSRGATWGEGDTIILATAALSTGLQRVSSAGGAAHRADDAERRARRERSPLAAVLAGRPGRAVHHHRYGGRHRCLAGSGTRRGRRYVEDAGSRGQSGTGTCRAAISCTWRAVHCGRLRSIWRTCRRAARRVRSCRTS